MGADINDQRATWQLCPFQRGDECRCLNPPAPKQRNTEAEKAEIRAGRIPPEWAKRPAKLRQKDRDARWTVKFSKARPRDDGTPQVDIAVPAFGYKNNISIDRRQG